MTMTTTMTMTMKQTQQWKLFRCSLLLAVVLTVTTTMAADIPPGLSLAPITMAPIAISTVAPTITVTAPVSVAPATSAPDTNAPASFASVTDAPAVTADTQSPVSTTAAPTSDVPVAVSPISDPPITLAPTAITTTATPAPTSTTFLPTASLSSGQSLQPTVALTTSPTIAPTLSPTSAPTRSPTGAPTRLPTSAPTGSPTRQPSTKSPVTAQPTAPKPTSTQEVQTSDRFLVRQLSVASRMSEGNSEFFRATTEAFLGELFAQMERPIFDVQIWVMGQTLLSGSSRRRTKVRNLEELLPLEVEMAIEGKYVRVESDSNEYEVDLGLLSGQFFEVEGAEFVSRLQKADNVTDAVYFQNVKEVVSVDEFGNTPSGSPANSPSDGDGGSGLALGGIIAIAVCGGLAILLVAVLAYLRFRKPPTRQPVDNGMNAKPVALASKQSITNKPVTTKSLAASSGAQSGSNYNYDERSSVGYSDMQSNLGNDTLQGIDTMSYAYSLDHGIDGSVISSVESEFMGQSTSGSTIPFEIPMVSSLGAVSSPPTEPKDMFSNSSKFTRECFAPPGRLGIVIDTTVEGPVIHKVNPGSPLEGIVWPGDIIVAIDDTDTRALTANEITALMAKNMHQRRKLTIMSDA